MSEEGEAQWTSSSDSEQDGESVESHVPTEAAVSRLNVLNKLYVSIKRRMERYNLTKQDLRLVVKKIGGSESEKQKKSATPTQEQLQQCPGGDELDGRDSRPYCQMLLSRIRQGLSSRDARWWDDHVTFTARQQGEGARKAE